MCKNFGSIILCCCIWSSVCLAQNCIKTDDCSSLGYKQTSVDNDLPNLKCPHGDGYYYNCENKFKYTCTNQAESPYGKGCLGLYEKCNCKKGYIWLFGKCQKTCEIGDIYYIDGTCSSADDYDKSKKVLGVVVHLNASKLRGLIMAAVAEEMKSAFGGGALSQPKNVVTYGDEKKDFGSCFNTKNLAEQGYTGAQMAQGYQISSNTLGKWCLPAAGILYKVSQNLVKINYTMNALGALPLDGYYWSSTISSIFGNSWDKAYININSGQILTERDYTHNVYNIRPVSEF